MASDSRTVPASFRFPGLVVAAMLFGALVTGCGQGGGRMQGRASDEWTRSYTLQDGGEFQIVGGVGDIEVTGGPGSAIEVKAERIARAVNDAVASTIPSNIRIGEDVTPEKIVLRNEGLPGIIVGVQTEVNFHVTVPSSTRLRLRTASGDIRVANVDGSIVAAATAGDVRGTALGGGVEVRSTNGSVTIDMSRVSRDPIDLRATNGTLTLTLPPTAHANVDATCTRGSIDVKDLQLELTGDQSARRTRGRLNDGGTAIELTTTNGDIHLRGAVGGGPTS